MDLASVWNYQNFITLTSNTFDVFWILTELVKVAMSTTATSMLLVLRLMSLKCAEVWSSFHDLYTRQVVQYQGKLCPRDIVQDRFMTLIKRKHRRANIHKTFLVGNHISSTLNFFHSTFISPPFFVILPINLYISSIKRLPYPVNFMPNIKQQINHLFHTSYYIKIVMFLWCFDNQNSANF